MYFAGREDCWQNEINYNVVRGRLFLSLLVHSGITEISSNEYAPQHDESFYMTVVYQEYSDWLSIYDVIFV